MPRVDETGARLRAAGLSIGDAIVSTDPFDRAAFAAFLAHSDAPRGQAA
jgi:hypothetical protein